MKKHLKMLAMTCLIMALLLSSAVSPESITLLQSGSTADALGTVVASIDFSSGEAISNNAGFLDTNDPKDEPYTEKATMGGVSCRKIPAGKYIYFNFSKNVVPTDSRNLLIDITYWNESNNSVWVNYNGTENDYSIADFTRTNTNDWATTTIVLTDAAFKGSMRENNDLRMGYGEKDVYIRSVSVSIGSLDPDSEPIPNTPDSNSEFKGRTFAGYQMWHRAGNNAEDWNHWSYGNFPSPGLQKNVNVSSWPDVSVYPENSLYQTNLADLGNGNKAVLYNSTDPAIISTHFDLMEKAGIDGVSIQRFVGGIGKTITKTGNNYLDYARINAERTGRLFYVGYDLNGAGDDILECFKNDWVYEIEQTRALTASPNYATVNGKPVVEIWGIGHDFGISEEKMSQIIDFFHSRGCYIIAGAPRYWRDGTTSTAYSLELYNKIDCISPWTVGVYGDITGANEYLNDFIIPDTKYCKEHGMDYLPVCFAGSGNWLSDNGTFSETDRVGGKLLWTQIRNAKSVGLNSVYIAMFDEFEENTNILNSATDYFDIPTNEYFETLAKNGVWTSSDYYLRLTGAASKLLRDEIPDTEDIPVPYSEGPIYFRNSFEYRDTVLFINNIEKAMTLQIDPCFHDNEEIISKNVSATASVEKLSGIPSKTGLYAAKLTGSATGGAEHEYVYKTNSTKTVVKPEMSLSYSVYAADENGKSAYADLIFSDGSRLSELDFAYKSAVTVSENSKWLDISYTFGKGSLIGKEITGIALVYDSANTGDFTAYFDDMIIKTDEGTEIPDEPTTDPIENDPVDLYISEVGASDPENIYAGTAAEFYAVIGNFGKVDCTEDFTVSFFIDGLPMGETVCTQKPAANGERTVVKVTAPEKFLKSGTHTVAAVVNWKKQIKETGYNNNILRQKIAIIA